MLIGPLPYTTISFQHKCHVCPWNDVVWSYKHFGIVKTREELNIKVLFRGLGKHKQMLQKVTCILLPNIIKADSIESNLYSPIQCHK